MIRQLLWTNIILNLYKQNGDHATSTLSIIRSPDAQPCVIHFTYIYVYSTGYEHAFVALFVVVELSEAVLFLLFGLFGLHFKTSSLE